MVSMSSGYFAHVIEQCFGMVDSGSVLNQRYQARNDICWTGDSVCIFSSSAGWTISLGVKCLSELASLLLCLGGFVDIRFETGKAIILDLTSGDSTSMRLLMSHWLRANYFASLFQNLVGRVFICFFTRDLAYNDVASRSARRTLIVLDLAGRQGTLETINLC